MIHRKAALLSLLIVISSSHTLHGFTSDIGNYAYYLWTTLSVGIGSSEVIRAYTCMNDIDAWEAEEESVIQKHSLEVLHENLLFISMAGLLSTAVSVAHLSQHTPSLFITTLKALTCLNIAGETYLLTRYAKKQLFDVKKKKKIRRYELEEFAE